MEETVILLLATSSSKGPIVSSRVFNKKTYLKL